MVAILPYVDDVVMLFKLGASLQRLLNKLYDLCTSSSLEVNLSKAKHDLWPESKETKPRGILLIQ